MDFDKKLYDLNYIPSTLTEFYHRHVVWNTTLKGIILFFLLVAQLSTHAQTLVTLNSLREIKNRKFYLSGIIDARSERELIGIVQTGIHNKQEPAQFKNGLSAEFNVALSTYLKPSELFTPVIMRILKLTIFERTLLTSETGNAEVIVEFYTDKDQKVILLTSAGSSRTTKGLDVTHSHARNIEHCLLDCLNQVNDYLNNHAIIPTEGIRELKELSTVPGILDNYDYPILNAASLKKGVYRNFIEFRNNNPGIGIDFLKEKVNHTGEVHGAQKGVLKTEEGKLDDCWGYSDGENIFIKIGQEFFALSNDEGIFWFNGYDVSDYKSDISNPGKAIFTAAFTGYLMVQQQVSWTSKRVRYAINLGNGDLFPVD